MPWEHLQSFSLYGEKVKFPSSIIGLPIFITKWPNVNIGDKVVAVNPVIRLWGPYMTYVSITCDDVVVATTTGKDKA